MVSSMANSYKEVRKEAEKENQVLLKAKTLVRRKTREMEDRLSPPVKIQQPRKGAQAYILNHHSNYHPKESQEPLWGIRAYPNPYPLVVSKQVPLRTSHPGELRRVYQKGCLKVLVKHLLGFYRKKPPSLWNKNPRLLLSHPRCWWRVLSLFLKLNLSVGYNFLSRVRHRSIFNLGLHGRLELGQDRTPRATLELKVNSHLANQTYSPLIPDGKGKCLQFELGLFGWGLKAEREEIQVDNPSEEGRRWVFFHRVGLTSPDMGGKTVLRWVQGQLPFSLGNNFSPSLKLQGMRVEPYLSY